MAKQSTPRIIDATIIENGVTPEQQAALEADLRNLERLTDIGALLNKHSWVVPTITGACATAGLIISSKMAVTAAVTVASMIGGGMLVAYGTYLGLLTLVVTMLLKYRDTLMQWATALAVLVAKGMYMLYDLACEFLGWLKDKCVALWDWFCSLFSSEDKAAQPVAA